MKLFIRKSRINFRVELSNSVVGKPTMKSWPMSVCSEICIIVLNPYP
jgi:hypothetical protein